jgi:magnesium-transporting ATPase (P-type)
MIDINKAEQNPATRKDRLAEIYEEIESNILLLGATVMEDKL